MAADAAITTATVVDAAWVARRLGLDRKTVYNAAAAGEIPARRVGRRWLFVREVIDAWLRCGSRDSARD